MGNAESAIAKAHGFDIDQLQKDSQFTIPELRRLRKRYEKLDADKNGRISAEEFMSLPELANNPLVERIIDTMDRDKSGEVDFQEFIMALSVFVRGTKEDKLKFAFRIYDMDRDGYISNGELFMVLKMMVGSNLKETQLQQIVDKTIMYADQDADGKISFEEFCQVIATQEVEQKMTVEM
eukprot:comp12718_c1_seq1/m.7827 comp12718_c1_seq1/g.7827  ORF comp12718_c1_seq1/g.7827 comp12718_c1_seq1/m.7827 type:complete len:180 (-) comp12718_c1_seq1:549-1088(-)